MSESGSKQGAREERRRRNRKEAINWGWRRGKNVKREAGYIEGWMEWRKEGREREGETGKDEACYRKVKEDRSGRG